MSSNATVTLSTLLRAHFERFKPPNYSKFQPIWLSRDILTFRSLE